MPSRTRPREARVRSEQKAEMAAGVGQADGDNHETAQGDADGRRLWEFPQPLRPTGRRPGRTAPPPEPRPYRPERADARFERLIYTSRTEMIRFCRGHRNPKRKRGNRLNASLTLRISIDFGRAKYNEIGGCCLRSAQWQARAVVLMVDQVAVRARAIFPEARPLAIPLVPLAQATGELKNSVRAEFPINSTRPLTAHRTFRHV